MKIHLKTKSDNRMRISLAGLTGYLANNGYLANKNCSSDVASVWNSAPVVVGNRQTTLGEVFDIQCDVDEVMDVDEVYWSGTTQLLDDLAAGLQAGSWFVDGDVGDRAGYQMGSGRLEIRGSAGHWLSAGNTGGQVLVHGDVGDYAAASLPGEKLGCNGGEVVINGNAGDFLGRRLRRGLVAVKGATGIGCGWELRAGTIVCGSLATDPDQDRVASANACDEILADGMIRGTIIIPYVGSQQQIDKLWPNAGFQKGIVLRQPVWPLLRSRLLHLGYKGSLPEGSDRFQIVHSQHQYGGRGEIWLAVK